LLAWQRTDLAVLAILVLRQPLVAPKAIVASVPFPIYDQYRKWNHYAGKEQVRSRLPQPKLVQGPSGGPGKCTEQNQEDNKSNYRSPTWAKPGATTWAINPSKGVDAPAPNGESYHALLAGWTAHQHSSAHEPTKYGDWLLTQGATASSPLTTCGNLGGGRKTWLIKLGYGQPLFANSQVDCQKARATQAPSDLLVPTKNPSVLRHGLY
jgi:hypothetical protein